MEILVVILAFLLLIIGILGCFLPILPGPPLSYGGLLLLHVAGIVDFSSTQLLVWLAVVVILQVVDYLTPYLGSKYSGGTPFGNRGCLGGTLIGMFFMPWGIVVGPFLGAVLGELLGGRDLPNAIRAGIGTLIGFLLGSLLKIIVCFYFLVQFIVAVS